MKRQRTLRIGLKRTRAALGISVLVFLGLLGIGLFGWIPAQPEGPWTMPTQDLAQGLHFTHQSLYSGLQGYFKRGGDVVYFETRYQYFHPWILLSRGEFVAVSGAQRGLQGQIYASLVVGDTPPDWPATMPSHVMLPHWADGFHDDFYHAIRHCDIGWWYQKDLELLHRL